MRTIKQNKIFSVLLLMFYFFGLSSLVFAATTTAPTTTAPIVMHQLDCGPQHDAAGNPTGEYKLCFPIPGSPDTPVSGPIAYLSRIYYFALSMAAVITVAYIMYYGIKYIIAKGNAAEQTDAKSGITSAIFGIILFLSAVLIINTLNPTLLSNLKELEAPEIEVKKGGLSPFDEYLKNLDAATQKLLDDARKLQKEELSITPNDKEVVDSILAEYHEQLTGEELRSLVTMENTLLEDGEIQLNRKQATYLANILSKEDDAALAEALRPTDVPKLIDLGGVLASRVLGGITDNVKLRGFTRPLTDDERKKLLTQIGASMTDPSQKLLVAMLRDGKPLIPLLPAQENPVISASQITALWRGVAALHISGSAKPERVSIAQALKSAYQIPIPLPNNITTPEFNIQTFTEAFTLPERESLRLTIQRQTTIPILQQIANTMTANEFHEFYKALIDPNRYNKQ